MSPDSRSHTKPKRFGAVLSRAWKCWRGVVLAAVCALIGIKIAEARSPSATLPTLTTAKAAHDLSSQEARRAYPILLRGVVTYYDPIHTPQPAIFFDDSTRGVYVALAHSPAHPLIAGDLVEITGVSGPGDYSPIVDHAEARLMGKGHLPFKAVRVSKNEMLEGKAEAEWVEVEGVVHEVHRYGKSLYLDLALPDGDITATTVKEAGADYDALVDSRVILRGVAAAMFNRKRQLTGARIFFPGMSSLRVLEPGPAHPFELPVQRVADLLVFNPKSGLHHRDHIRGTVTLLWPGRILCVQDGSGNFCAQINQGASPSAPDGNPGNLQPGALVDVIGFPETGEFTPTLMHATYQMAGPAAAREGRLPAVTISASEAMHGDHDAGLITIEGKLIGYDRAASDPTLMLSSGNFVFSVVVPKQAMSDTLSGIEEGSLLRVTGICSVQADRMALSTDGSFVGRSFRILLQSAGDITVAQRPSFWNAAHALILVGVALLAVMVALSGVGILRHRVQLQTRMIRESEERFRHLATHDSLTELPNRASILDSLEVSVTQAQKLGTSVCIALIDLDHFKSINDTLGHLAGDEVLRESARRLAGAVRSHDVVGRYGGEEFLIVFDNMELETGAARCELVRKILCERPIPWEERLLTITCSIGVVTALIPGSAVPTALIARADQAMYEAKNLGRNRVVAMGQGHSHLTELLIDQGAGQGAGQGAENLHSFRIRSEDVFRSETLTDV